MKKEKQNVVNNKIILNLIQDLQRLLLSLRNDRRGRFQIKFGMTVLYNNGGFTLIELLVVVLIIGILAAVAVPQYRIAVEKSRTIQVFTLLQAIADAEEVYFLANGKYSINYSELDISLPTEVTKDNERLILQNGATISLNTTRSGFVAGGTARTQINYFFNHYSVDNSPFKPGMIICAARTKDNIGLNVCKSLPQAEFFSNANCGMWGNGAEACTSYTVRR